MNRFFGVFTDRYKLFAYVFLVAVGALLLSLFGKGIEATLAISAGIGLVLFITKSVWFSDKYGETTVRILSLMTAGSAVAAFVGWPALVESYLKPLLGEQYPALQANFDTLPPFVFVFLAFVIYIVNGFRTDQTGMGVHPTPLDRDIPEPSFNDRVKAVCGALTDDLKSIDTRTNWSARYFTPLDAEVEVNTPNGKERKVTDLLKAIRQSKKRLFLVLGTPGAGKSVALRKLCQDLAEEVTKTGKIPVYINLREWHISQKWSEDHPPTVEQLYQFVFENLKSRDIVTSKFFERYFERLYETGRLYFVLDSFDEIPAVLDEKENSELIHQLSAVIFKFLKGARQAEAQGILASRLFRKPTHEFQTEVTLEVRPFTEQKIISTFENYGIFTQNLIKTLFKDRPELVPIARNPFSAILIAEYADNNHNQLPPNQSEMYANYFSRTLDSAAQRIARHQLTKQQIIDYTIDIADTMFEHYGLEAPINQLVERLKPIPVEAVIDVLKFARLGRLGSGDENLFSFSHRRFVEYFAVQKMIQSNYEPDYLAIPNDSKQRDALVLYCEVAPSDKVMRIANYCWYVIEELKNPQCLEVVHTLRFLRDAFQGHLEYIAAFKDKLAIYLNTHINAYSHVLSVKLILELLPLVDDTTREESIRKAFLLKNPLLEETAIKSSRNLPFISEELEYFAILHVAKESIYHCILNFRKTLFLFSLSDAFYKVRLFTNLRLIYLTLILLVFITYTFYHPLMGIPVLLFNLFFMVILDSEDGFINDFFMSFFSFCILFLSFVGNIIFFKSDSSFYLPTFSIFIAFLFFIPWHYLVISPKIFFRFNIEKIHQTLFLAILGPITAICFILFQVYSKDIQEYIPFLDKVTEFYLSHKFFISLSAVLTSVLTMIFYASVKIYRQRIEIQHIDWSVLKDRKGIFVNLVGKRRKTQELILRYLENNVRSVTGEWPDTWMFNADETDPVYLRLAALEEKWLGLDR